MTIKPVLGKESAGKKDAHWVFLRVCRRMHVLFEFIICAHLFACVAACSRLMSRAAASG